MSPTVAGGSVWVCVPTYDEAENIRAFVGALLAVFDEHSIEGRILVIDDASPDGTGEIADELARDDDRVSVLHRPGKAGIGPAYLAGFARALEAGADLIVEMDCDFSHDPRALPELLAASGEADVVLGSRYVPGGAVDNWGPVRRAVSRGGCWYARTVLGLETRDLTGGFKCFRRPVVESLIASQHPASGYAFQVQMTYLALCRGYSVCEVPIRFADRAAGRSKMSWRIVREAAVLVPRLRLQERGAADRVEPAREISGAA